MSLRFKVCWVVVCVSAWMCESAEAGKPATKSSISAKDVLAARRMLDQLRATLPVANARLTADACQRAAELGRCEFLRDAVRSQVKRHVFILNQMREFGRGDATVKSLESELAQLKREEQRLQKRLHALQSEHLRKLQAAAESDAPNWSTAEVDALLKQLASSKTAARNSVPAK